MSTQEHDLTEERAVYLFQSLPPVEKRRIVQAMITDLEKTIASAQKRMDELTDELLRLPE